MKKQIHGELAEYESAGIEVDSNKKLYCMRKNCRNKEENFVKNCRNSTLRSFFKN